MASTRDRYNKQSLGSLTQKIAKSKVLLVGAGGIGCELLKNLVLTGFRDIVVVDLDTIDLSNLNRQFLFRHHHIKQSKASVASEVAKGFRPGVNIQAHQQDIKDPRFNARWFSEFDVVFNALDNLDARRHVNRMCLAGGVPLIESGTTGFNGQVQVIIPYANKYLHHQEYAQPADPLYSLGEKLLACLFGESEESDNIDSSTDANDAEEIKNLRKESEELAKIRASMDTPEFTEKVFQRIFHDDIDRLRRMEDMWRTRQPPEPLTFAPLNEKANEVNPAIITNGQKPWSLEENFYVFRDSLMRLSKRYTKLAAAAQGTGVPPNIYFDKDDPDTLDFVASAANLRSHIFSIPILPKFQIQEIAGNIIPAIATTNAMTASLCVLQAFKVLKGNFDKAKMLFLDRSGARAIASDSLKPPNPLCPVCSTVWISVDINAGATTLADLVETCREKLGYEGDFTIMGPSGIIYDFDYEDNLPQPLTKYAGDSGARLTVIDGTDWDEDGSDGTTGPRVNVEFLLYHKEDAAEKDRILLPDTLPSIPKKTRPPPPPPTAAEKNAEAVTAKAGTPEHKRKRETDGDSDIDIVDADDHDQRPAKKRQTADVEMVDADAGKDKSQAIVLDEEEDAAIIIDD
ncbi:E1 ubiquitin-activating protein uba2 [Ascosphaera atra]|nr:E1 ubiquitin-activating protein uba2 [Ascosphaera atra]